jgi:hypothetical protein
MILAVRERTGRWFRAWRLSDRKPDRFSPFSLPFTTVFPLKRFSQLVDLAQQIEVNGSARETPF